MSYDDLAPDTFHSPWKYFINPLIHYQKREKVIISRVQIRYILQNLPNSTSFSHHQKSDPNGSQYVLIGIQTIRDITIRDIAIRDYST